MEKRKELNLKTFLFICILATYSLNSIVAQPEYVSDLINQEKLAQIKYKKQDKGSIKKIDEAKNLTFEISTDVYMEKQFGLSAKIPIEPRNLRKGEILLIGFEAKTTFASLETDESKVLWQLKTSDNPKEKIRRVVSIGREWKSYYVPIEVNQYISKKDLSLSLQFGFPPQKLEMRNISLFYYDKKTDIADLPSTKITYAGMEPDAKWRVEAFQRIDSIRKGDFTISLNQGGKPLENVEVRIKMLKHDFNWGVALRAKNIVNNDFYQQMVANNFNLVVIENALKMKHYDRSMNEQSIIKALDQLQSKGLQVKGHVLLWPGFRHLPPNFKTIKDDTTKIHKFVDSHVEKILESTKGKVDRWDVVNEIITNHDLQDIIGSEYIIYNLYNKLRVEYPELRRFINEYGIINRGGLNIKKQQDYFDNITRIDLHTNGAIQGIGIQSHIGTDLTPPVKILDILDKYAALNKDISISEFTMDITDPQVRQFYTEDFMIAAFSHPSVTEFLFWGLKGTPDDKVDIFQKDWTLGSMGKAYFNLANNLWKTDITEITDNEGTINNRAFYGVYEYSYMINGAKRTGKFHHIPGQQTVVNIDLP